MQSRRDIALICVSGDVDVASAGVLRDQIERAIASGACRIILNMARVSYVDSAGMAVILGEARKLRQKGSLLSLANVSPEVYRALRIACLLDFIPTTCTGERRAVSALPPRARPAWQRTLPIDAVDMHAARTRVRELLEAIEPLSGDAAFDLCLACGEALGNAVDHACAEGILLTVAAYDDRVICEITDCGEGFELAWDEEPVSECLCAEGERGRGIKLMRLLCDDVSIRRREGVSGTVVRLVKLVG